MLKAVKNDSIIQRVSIMPLRTRVDQNGTGIFYHVPLRREVLIPIDPNMWDDPRWNLSAVGLSSQIGSTFSEIPPGMMAVNLYSIIGTIVNTPELAVVTTEGDTTVIDANGLVGTFEITEPDLRLLQEQNQMALVLAADGYCQFNAQDYGEGLTEDGRERDILNGSVWVTPKHFDIWIDRTQTRSAAGSIEEIHAIREKALARNGRRQGNARRESFGNRAERDERRAQSDMPVRQGSNTHIITGAHFGRPRAAGDR